MVGKRKLRSCDSFRVWWSASASYVHVTALGLGGRQAQRITNKNHPDRFWGFCSEIFFVLRVVDWQSSGAASDPQFVVLWPGPRVSSSRGGRFTPRRPRIKRSRLGHYSQSKIGVPRVVLDRTWPGMVVLSEDSGWVWGNEFRPEMMYIG